MIVIKVELHSAVTGEISQLGQMIISNDRTGTDNSMNYNGRVMRKPKFLLTTKRGRVENHPRKTEVIWVLIARMLKSMGYG